MPGPKHRESDKMESFSMTIAGRLPMSSSKAAAVPNEMISSMNLWYI